VGLLYQVTRVSSEVGILMIRRSHLTRIWGNESCKHKEQLANKPLPPKQTRCSVTEGQCDICIASEGRMVGSKGQVLEAL